MSTALRALCLDTCWRHTPIVALLQIKSNKDIIGIKNLKLLLVLNIFYLRLLQLALCRVAALKVIPYTTHSADYIFLSVL